MHCKIIFCHLKKFSCPTCIKSLTKINFSIDKSINKIGGKKVEKVKKQWSQGEQNI